MQVRADLVSLPGVGASALEVSHRSAWFKGVIQEAEANLRALLRIGDEHHVLFCQGGATMQFSLVPVNLLRGNQRPADFVITGSWGGKAVPDAAKEGDARIAWTNEDEGFVRIPTNDELARSLSDDPAYVHITTNETIQGVEFSDTPALPDDVTLVADASSNFLSRPVDVSRYGVLYAGAQKNAGPAGVTVVATVPLTEVQGVLDAFGKLGRPARAHPGRSTDDDELPDVCRERLDAQHAAGVLHLRAHAGDPLDPR